MTTNRTRLAALTASIMLLLVLAVGLAVRVGATGTAAQTYTVNLKSDLADIQVGDGLCDTDGGTAGEQCTLRAAIQESNASAGVHDTIAFHLGNFVPIDQVIPISSALPEITDPVDILGPNWTGAGVVLDGNAGAYDGLDISAGSSTVRRIIVRDWP